MQKVFLLSPANSGGLRAQLIFNPRARFDLAHRLQRGESVPIGEIFSFLSGLYFRGKLTYARKFANPPRKVPGILVITPNCGIYPAETPITLDHLRHFGSSPVDADDERYTKPLIRDASLLKEALKPSCQVVLLGSISTNKYVKVLLEVFGPALFFPPSFVGRGDMSRGGLLLRSASSGEELEYQPIAGATRKGQRPPKLEPRFWGFRVTEGTTQVDLPRKKRSSGKRPVSEVS